MTSSRMTTTSARSFCAATFRNNFVTLMMKMNYAQDLYQDGGATLDDLREAVTTLEETASTARRVLGGAHPVTTAIVHGLKASRRALAARQTPPGSS